MERSPAVDSCWPADLVRLYRTERTTYVRVAYLLTGHREVAEEVVQDAFVACGQRWVELERPRAYLRTAVVNRSRSWLRRLQLQRDRERPGETVDEMEPDELWDALGRLDERRRAAIVLRFYHDLPDVEIAEALDCRPATVRTLVHRGLQDLRREVDR
ncbi:MAG: sigma-70 family RNA polymerase sigma factor [Actinomycetota bacterium]